MRRHAHAPWYALVIMKLNYASLVVVLIAAAYLSFRYAGGQAWTPWHLAGVAIALPALERFLRARVQLGRNLSVQAKANALITAVLYSRIPTPIYVFGGLLIACFIIWAHRPWWLLVFSVLIPLQVVRARKEAAVLEATFGDAYREYKRKTWF